MDPDPGGPKTYGSCGSGSATKLKISTKIYEQLFKTTNKADFVWLKHYKIYLFEDVIALLFH
jgi:hypothetical protein